MTASRKTLRKDLQAELAPLITSLQNTSDFFAYEPADYKGRSPVVFLNSAGAEHQQHTKALDSDFYINVHLLTLYADLAGGTYNEEDASDLLDDLEAELSAAVQTKQSVYGKWQKLEFYSRSNADQPQQVGGNLYLHEVITLHARMY